MNLKETYNKIANDWHADHSTDDWWIEGADTFAQLLPERARVLDAGCGTGVKSKYLVNKGFRVLGVDFAEEMVSIARRSVPGAEFRVLDLYHAKDLPETFDGIFMQAVLLHFPKTDAREILRGLVEKITPGGFLYVAVKGTWPGCPEEELRVENDYGYEYERFFSYYSQDELEKHFLSLGLSVISSFSTRSGKTDWVQVIGKKPE